MPTRQFMIQIHLVIASVFLPLLLMMPLTGALYLWGFKGEQTKEEAFRITDRPPVEKLAQEEFFRAKFKEQNIDYDFEYVRAAAKEYIFRPATQIHYIANVDGDELIFSRINPNLLKRMMELHKGHGPILMRWFESLFGVALIMVTLSGLWLAFTVPKYRRLTFISFGIGLAAIIVCMI
jgi:hypothetical protein